MHKTAPAHSIVLMALALAASLLIGARASGADCGDWIHGPGQGYNGLNEATRAMVKWDPDGEGPQATLVIFGGEFTQVGEVPVNRIAAWDGSRFHALGEGFNGRVLKLAVLNGQLIAGGEFTMSGKTPVSRIAAWDGAEWRPLGLGLSGPVYELYVANGILHVGGGFLQAGDVPASCVATWDGAQWNPLGEGLNALVAALYIWNDQLYAGGYFTKSGAADVHRIARWDGAIWTEVGEGIPVGAVHALTEYNNELIVAGGFVLDTPPQQYHILRWNGKSWGLLPNGPNEQIRLLAVVEDVLWVGTVQSGTGLPPLRVWNGAAWDIVGTIGAEPYNSSFVTAIAPLSDGRVMVAGQFHMAGDVGAHSVAIWEEGELRSLRTGLPPGKLGGLAVVDDTLYAFPDRTGTARWNDSILEWDDGVWKPIIDRVYRPVRTAITFQGELVVGGLMLEVEGVAVKGIARRRHNGDWEPMHYITDPLSTILAIVNDELISVSGRAIRRWNGAEWESLGELFDGGVVDVFEFDSRLTAIDGGARTALAWNGVEWEPLGEPFEGGETARLCVYRGDLYAAGSFTSSGGTPLNHVARWNGVSWEPVGDGVNGPASWLTTYRDALVVHGSFTQAGAVPVARTALWNGETWKAPGFTDSFVAKGAVEYRGELIFWNDQPHDWNDLPIDSPSPGSHWFRWDGRIAGDADANSIVDLADLSAILAHWGGPGPEGDGDFNGAVDFDDITAVIANWNADCE